MHVITIFYDGSHYLYRWLKPLFSASKIFAKYGYKLEYSDVLDYFPVLKNREMANLKRISNSRKMDIVFLAFHHSTSYLCNCSFEERSSLLKQIKSNCNKLVWLDTADSTGTSMFDVLPFVDIYLKKQLLKDRSLYSTPLYGSRLFCDYYHRTLGVEDSQLVSKSYPLLNTEFGDKIRLSWNVGLGDLFAKGIKLILSLKATYNPPLIDPNERKSIDIHFRGSGYSPIAGYQRNICKELVSSITEFTHPDVKTKVPYNIYVDEIKKSSSVLSPFGWGEVCTRDFESFLYGATLLKPSMEHCETFPNWFIPDETYVSIDWDFSNFDSVIKGINSKLYKDIAVKGQEKFRYYRLKEEGITEFVLHVIHAIS